MTQWQPQTGSEHPSRTPDGKMRIRDVATGQVADRDPWDAKALVESGAWAFVAVPPMPPAPPLAVAPSTFAGPVPAGDVLEPEPPERPEQAVERLARELRAAEATAAIRDEPVVRRP